MLLLVHIYLEVHKTYIFVLNSYMRGVSGRDVKEKVRSEIKINVKYRNIKCSFNNTDLKEIHLTEKN